MRDRDRPLNERGEKDAPLMGQRLLRNGARPTLVLTSPAVRTLRTAQIIARELGYPKEFLQREDDLYLASPAQIAVVLGRQDGGFRDIIVCGHNPGLTELANELTDQEIDNIPTCGIVGIDLTIDSWADLPGAKGTLTLFDFPPQE